MKKTLIFLVSLLLLSACAFTNDPYKYNTYPCGHLNCGTLAVINESACNADLWNHVYNPQRLTIINPCIAVEGTIRLIRTEKDGDLHIQLIPDSQYANLINNVNIEKQNSSLVLEPICVKTVSQEDAIAACTNFTYPIDLPKIGEHVTVIGSYVLDTAHGWNEIHPVSKFIRQ